MSANSGKSNLSVKSSKKNSHRYTQRLKQLRAKLPPQTALLLTTPTDVMYFTGFEYLVPEEREALVLITPSEIVLFHASFSPVASRDGVVTQAGCDIHTVTRYLQRTRSQQEISHLWVDKSSLFVSEYEHLLTIDSLEITGFDRELIWSQRRIKATSELDRMREAGKIVSQVVLQVQAEIEVGQTEVEISERIEGLLKSLGSEKPAFPTIVAFGDHAALPHHQPTRTPLTQNIPILIDCGATVEGYRSDLTRTWWFGPSPATTDFQQVQATVHQAYEAACDLLRTQMKTGALTARDIDQTARKVIAEAGYGDFFIHTTGHGVGLDIHEDLSLNWKNPLLLVPGMTLTIEPGIYLEEEFGYRHENTLVLTESGYEILTRD